MKFREKDKILILSATYGDGHKQVANAISEAVDLNLPDTEPIILDIMQWLHPFLYPVSNYFYKKVIKRFPQVYSYIYRKTRERSAFSTKLNTFFSLGMGSMLEILQSINPTVVVCTYPFAASMISKLKEQGLIDVPLVTIITDYTDHSYWIHPFTDQYVVGSEQVKDRLISLGVERYKIKCTGIPIRQKFVKTESRDLLATKYDINPNQFTILVMGGGEGLIGKGLSTFHALERISTPIQLIVICGRNKKLQKQLQDELRNSKHKVLVLGFCENVNELMAISDLMISKPGGVTISEAMAMELPLLIYNPLPGQEEDNADYLVNSGLAILAENESDLVTKIHHMIHDSFPLLSMKLRTKMYQSKTSSIDAVDVIIRTANRGKEEQQMAMG
ncbi:MGDG synthase family glycosyltransferase [Neobacillus massiliamazoniensis]|uniref:1,2-diacylglycerol 3-glucosyltransferase n=1 Tax=Neobacillus massiliamazoniensis TaxID=1499688 RepID=A0A0U1NSG5_9BACI|nr:glycosyltransferase [Neobacillus massiliamazoniensis]CRK81001.1 1,2-diacylglycerol 3-glucosyltransferase [Neobacillus massiliamazoniensis]